MASAQVMKKQVHLEAGRRKLEEFRRKKAAERANKTAQTSQVSASNGVIYDKKHPETRHVRNTDSDGAHTSNAVGGPPGGIGNDDVCSYTLSDNHSFSSPDHGENQLVPPLSRLNDKELGNNSTSGFDDHVISNSHQKKENDAPGRGSFGMERVQSMISDLRSNQETNGASNQSHYHGYGLDKAFLNKNDTLSKDTSIVNLDASNSSISSASPKKSLSFLAEEHSGYADQRASGAKYLSYEDSFSKTGSSSVAYGSSYSSFMGSKFDSSGPMFGERNSSPWRSDINAGLSFDAPLLTTGNNRRSRPSSLDTINVSKGMAPSPSESPKAEPVGWKDHQIDSLQPHEGQGPANASFASDGEVNFVKHAAEGTSYIRNDFHPQKQNDDFAALEQHIEDLTQEKFSLQRALEASRALAESLAAENSALTENYNQQASIVTQLRYEMEKLQEEIKAQLAELEAMKLEYANAQLECNAADERAKLLASEVIGLEEKALRLRSSELKLERELENTQAEISSLKKKMSSLDKERQDLQSTIDALQEEKKLLHSKLRKAFASGKSVDTSNKAVNKANVATSTADLGDTDGDASTTGTAYPKTTASRGNHVSSFLSVDNYRHFSLDELSLTVPPDEIRVIENINSLICELAMEKEELVQALSAELSRSSKLKELNTELTRKLEAQTQRLELLTAQSMATEDVKVKQADIRHINESTVYADEGDEVVERVLGWIMKLFPGGPSKRQTKRL